MVFPCWWSNLCHHSPWDCFTSHVPCGRQGRIRLAFTCLLRIAATDHLNIPASQFLSLPLWHNLYISLIYLMPDLELMGKNVSSQNVLITNVLSLYTTSFFTQWTSLLILLTLQALLIHLKKNLTQLIAALSHFLRLVSRVKYINKDHINSLNSYDLPNDQHNMNPTIPTIHLIQSYTTVSVTEEFHQNDCTLHVTKVGYQQYHVE